MLALRAQVASKASRRRGGLLRTRGLLHQGEPDGDSSCCWRNPTSLTTDWSGHPAEGRYWLVGGDVTVTGPRGNSVSSSGAREWVDPIIGARVASPLGEGLLFRLRGDIGGFGAASDFTWNIEAMGEYRCSECCGIQLGYRVLDVDYARGDGFAYDVNYRGPVAMVVFDF